MKKVSAQILALEAAEQKKKADTQGAEKTLEARLGADALAKAKIKEEFERLQKERDQAARDYGKRLAENQRAMGDLQQQRMDACQSSTKTKQERDGVKSNLVREQARCRDAEEQKDQLDAEIEKLLSTTGDRKLELLYTMDMDLVRKIDQSFDGQNDKLSELARHAAAAKVQAIARGNKARSDVELIRSGSRVRE